MFRAPGPDDPRQDWLLREIAMAQRTLDEQIAAAAALPDSDLSKSQRLARYRAIRRETDNMFGSLDKSTRTWAERDVPGLYREGWFFGASQVGGSFDFTLPHRDALEIISYDAYDDIATRLQQVRAGFDETMELQELYEGLSLEDMVAIQGRTRSAVTQALLTGNADPKKVARQLAQDLWKDNPRLQITDAGGRNWNMQTYTRMLVRTKSANAYNAGSLNKYAEEGVQRVQVFDGVEHDPECSKANGQVWTLRQAMQTPIAHPNCRRAFAPVAGRGDVNRDTENEGIVAFDRVELGIGAIAALRHFSRSGEINMSSTLARLIWEGVELATFPMPLVDEFVTGFAHLGLRELDGWIESYIDPVLYHLGLIENVPARAELRAMNRPEQVLSRLAVSLRDANQAAYGTDYHPQVRALVQTLTRATARIELGVLNIRAYATDHVGGLGYLGFIASELFDTNRLGQITAETLLRIREDDAVDLREAARAATFLTDQFRELKRVHLRAANATHDELLEIYEDLDRIGDVAARILADEISVDDAPEVFIDFLRNYSLSTALGPVDPFSTRRITDLLNEVKATQRRVLAQIEEYQSVPRRRELAMAVSSGEDFPTHASDLFDKPAFEEAADVIAAKVAESKPVFDFTLYDEYRRFFLSARNHEDSEIFQTMLRYMEIPEPGEIPPAFARLIPGIDQVAELRPVEVFDLLTKTLYHLQVTDDGLGFVGATPLISALKGPLDIVKASDTAWVLALFDPKFFVEHEELWRQFIETNMPRKNWITGAFGAVEGSAIDPNLLAIQYTKFIDEIFEGVPVGSSDLQFSNLRQWLGSTFGEANVQSLGSMGVSGETWSVWDEVTGQRLFIKKLQSSVGHTKPDDAMLSYIMTNWVYDQLGGTVAAAPTRVIGINPREAIVVMPFVDEADMLLHFMPQYSTYVDYGPMRRTYFFDLITGEADNHPGNIMIDSWSDGAQEIVIDREASFGFAYHGRVFDNPQKDAAATVMEQILGDAWLFGDDAPSAVHIDGPVALKKVTAGEFDVLTGVTRFDPEGSSRATNNAVVGIYFDIDGHNFPLVGQYSEEAYNLIEDLDELAATELWDTAGLAADELMEVAIPHGRVGWYQFSGHRNYAVSIRPRDSELELVQRLISSDPEVIQALREELEQYIIEGMKNIPPGHQLRSKIDEIWGLAEHPTPEAPGVGGAVDYVMSYMSSRVSKFVDGGVINTSGHSVEYVDELGSKFRIGEAQVLVNRETGEELRGTVFNIVEDTQGNIRIHFLPGVGHRLASKDLPPVIEIEVLEPEVWATNIRPQIELIERAEEAVVLLDDGLERLADVEPVELAPFIRKSRRSDELGLVVGFEEGNVEVVYSGKANDVVRVMTDTNDTVDVPASQLVKEAEQYIAAELSRIPQAYRPERINLHLNMLETQDGKAAFGFYHPDTGEVHISLAPVLSQGYVRAADGTYALRLEEGLSPWDLAQDADWDPFRRVLRHEFGHVVSVEIERQIRAIHVQRIVRDLANEFPGANSRSDLQFAVRQFFPDPDDPALLEKYGDDLVTALIQSRADMLDDLMYTNLVETVKEILDEGTSIPDHIRRHMEVVRTDPKKADEVVAEIYSMIVERYPDRPFAKAWPREIAEEWGVPQEAVSSLFNRSALNPPNFDPSTVEFQIWLAETMHPNARRIYRRDLDYTLWDNLDIRIEEIVEQVAEAGSGGFTVALDGTSPSRGYSVALQQFEEIVPVDTASEEDIGKAILAFVGKHRQLLEDHPELQYGGWLDSDGNLYLDVVRVMDDEIDAATFGFANHQRAMYSFENGRAIDLMDDAPDFRTWMQRHYPDDPVEEYFAKRRRVGAVQTKRTVKKQKVLETVVDDEGEFLPIGMEAVRRVGPEYEERIIDSMAEYIRNPTKDELAALKKLTLADLRERARELGVKGYSKLSKDKLAVEVGIAEVHEELTFGLIKERFIRVLETFEELNQPGKLTEEQLTNQQTKQVFQDLRGKYRFYHLWRDEFVDASAKTGIPAPWIIAGAARMSAGLDADANLWIARHMAELVGENGGLGHRLTADEALAIKKYLGRTLEEGEAARYLNEFGKPERADAFVAMAKAVKAGAYLNDYDPVLGTYIGHVLTIRNSQGLGATGKGYSYSTKYGFLQFQKALAGMQGRISLDEVITDTKVRSFSNNSLDPDDIARVGDVTADFHMSDIALWAIGSDKIKADEPRILGAGAGLRPIIGDIVRELYAEGWGQRLGANSPAQLQEILWGMWRDGKAWGLWGTLRKVGKRKL